MWWFVVFHVFIHLNCVCCLNCPHTCLHLCSFSEQGSKEGHNHAAETGQPKVEEKIFSDDELIALIDPIMSMDDVNKDGFIDYVEFVRAQKKAQSNNNNNNV